MVDSILTPDSSTCEEPQALAEVQHFAVENYLSELETENQKGIARENLGVYGQQDVYTQVEVDNNISKAVGDALRFVLAADDPHQILPKVTNLLKDYVRRDGTIPFTAPQKGVTPVLDDHLATKGYVLSTQDSHLKKTDPHNVMGLVNETLKQYALAKNVYNKSEVYSKEAVDKLVKPYIKSDGTTPFTAPQSGVTPVIDQHLATKRYVDNVLFKHNVESDPHSFLSILNQRLANYYKTTETYSKAETYSRAQIDQVVGNLVTDAAVQVIREHVNQYDPHGILPEVYSQHYVKRDGSVPFISIQKGIAGIESDDLATVGQINIVKEELQEKLEKVQPVWLTSGPVLTTVGYVEDNTSLPRELTLQEIMDAIFYGKTIEVVAPEIAVVGSSVEVSMHIRGNATISSAELYQNDKLIGTFERGDFLDWVKTVESEPILVNTTFSFKVTYDNGVVQTATCVTKVAYGIFVGAVSIGCMPGDLSYSAMLELSEMGTNAMYSYGENVEIIKHKFDFESPRDPKKLVLAIPSSYNQLDYMHTASQHFGTGAFMIEEVPVIVPGVPNPVYFTYYMYKEPLVAFGSEVTFKLSKHVE